jgi:hypothetical protein
MTSHASGRSFAVLIAVLAFLARGTPANGQTRLRPYAGGSISSFSVSGDEVDGRSVAGGLFAGLALSKYIDAEFEVAFPTDTFTRSYTGISESFAAPGATRAEIERLGVVTRFDKERDVNSFLSAVVIIHPPAGTRLTPGLIVGVSNQNVRDRTTYTTVSVPEGLDPQHRSVIGYTQAHSRNLGGPTIGANLAVALTPHLSIVPDVRYDYGSIGDEINNTLRTSVRMRWRF